MTKRWSKKIDKNSEDWRFECEVRHVLSMVSKTERNEYLSGVEKQRGLEAANKLRRGILDEWDRRMKAG